MRLVFGSVLVMYIVHVLFDAVIWFINEMVDKLQFEGAPKVPKYVFSLV